MSTFHVMAGAQAQPVEPRVRRIDFDDLRHALIAGWRDFLAMRSDILVAALIYPIIGIVLAIWSSGANVLPLLYPLMSGFALLGPLAAIGLYEISRRRDEGQPASARNALDVFRSPALPSIVALGAGLMALFLLWLAVAQALWLYFMGPDAPVSLGAMFDQVLTTPNGRMLLIVGNVVGFVFAAVAFCTSVVAFPMLLDRDVGVAVAVRTSFEAVADNPAEMAAWAAIVAVLLALGFLACFVGLAVVMPVLGHATWRLYRTLVQ